MRILRLLTGGSFSALCVLIVGFVCVDRLNHPGAALPRQVVLPEPSATGSIAQPKPAAVPVTPVKVAAPKIPNGFDTERLHALMRGDPILPSRR